MAADPGVRGTTDPVQAALATSNLRDLPEPVLAAVLEDSTRLRIPAGATLRDAGDMGPHLELVLTGLLRIYVAAPDGRSLTVRYGRAGDLMGLVSLYRDPYVMLGTIQAVTEAEVLSLRPAIIRRLADTDLAMARAMLRELSERVVSFIGEIPDNVFTSVRQRLVRHLLDLAADNRHGDRLVAQVSQQELADAVGTAREVVVRILRELREDGLVTTGREGVTILDPGRLDAERHGRADATRGAAGGV
jgi:CRP/FNR family transcriptional regulator